MYLFALLRPKKFLLIPKILVCVMEKYLTLIKSIGIKLIKNKI